MQNQQTSKCKGYEMIERQIIEEKSPRNGNTIKRYAKGKLLGKGGFAKCYEFVSLETNIKYAAKIIEKNSLTRSKAKEKLASEIKIHKALKSPYVVGFEHFFEDSENVYILLQLCPNQTLNELIKRRKRLMELEAKYYVYQIANALKDIHRQRVIHRDLKLGNLFLTDKLEIRVGDFGLAAQLNFQGEKRKTMCGTPNYIAPQILQNNHGHSYEVDIWSLGVITYAFLIGRPPFETNDVKTTYSKIKQCNYSFPENIALSKVAKNLISKMLQKDPCRRSTLDQILNDDFFNTPFPKTLPLSTLACPPNSYFMKQFASDPIEIKAEDSVGKDSFKGKKHTDRESTGKEMTRASSQERVETRNNVVQRALSTAGLMAAKIVMQKPQTMNVKIDSARQYQPSDKLGMAVWVNYFEQNNKFGMCYLLNSNAVGMRFNDSTCLISNFTFSTIRYVDQLSNESGKMEIYGIGEVPQRLNKKLKIINHYRKDLGLKKQAEEAVMSNELRIQKQRLKHRQTSSTAMNIYVVKYTQTSKVTIFWFNNQDYQVIFKDSTQLLISQTNVVYLNKFTERKNFLMNSLDQQSQQIKKRMNYTISIIEKLRNAGMKTLQQKENQPNLIYRSSSVTKVEKLNPQQTLRGSASTARLSNFKLVK